MTGASKLKPEFRTYIDLGMMVFTLNESLIDDVSSAPDSHVTSPVTSFRLHSGSQTIAGDPVAHEGGAHELVALTSRDISALP